MRSQTPARGWLLFAAVVFAAAIAMCTRDRVRLEEPDPHDTWRTLGIYSPARPGAGREDAAAALARDARRREERFRNAADPGHIFRSTRIGMAALRAASPAAIYELGAQLFHYRFTKREGHGDKDTTGLRRVHLGARGGPDAYTCAECHRRGGPAGGGDSSDNAHLDGDGDRPASALERNPIALSGAGLVELLAREMTNELLAQQRGAVRDARARRETVTVALSAKGVDFGEMKVTPDGKVDVSGIQGVDRDLRVRPFGHKGHAATLQDIVEDELLVHHGMQSTRLVLGGETRRIGTFGAPDPDGDGVADEISGGQLAVLTLFVAMQEVPQVEMPRRSDTTAAWPIGQQRFAELGCARCHVPSLPLDSTVYELPSEDGGAPIRIDLAKHGGEPRIDADGGPYRVYLFSDLKRHVMGPNLREHKDYRGVLGSQFLTRPLWGIARSRPYLHDGRAPILDEAILAHSGEALAARDAYAKLNDADRAPVRIYLVSLTRALRLSSP